MEFGIAVVSNLDAWRTVRRAEELGFSHAWFYDSQMLAPDVFVGMALAAHNTSRIKLGTGVLIPTNRIAPVAANALASLNQLAPGRIVFGVGTGFTARNTMGLGPMKLAEFREYLRVVQELLRGGTVEWECDGARRKIRFLNPEAGFINLRDKIPLHISAFAPRARRLTAEIADGWMTFMATAPRAIHEAAEVAGSCREAGRDPATLYRTVFTLGRILNEGESPASRQARAEAGPLATVFFHGLVEATIGLNLPPAIQPLLEEYRRQHALYDPADAKYLQMHKLHLIAVRPEEERFLTEDVMRMTTFTATAPELRERIRALANAGFDQLTVQLVPGHEAVLERWARLFETV
jgi:alkanesulfonate monooxygenase SsuD/methylene tetrahydromethanopterin reductase-like flavin-dependent oxidoreductase (luciferase family)